MKNVDIAVNIIKDVFKDLKITVEKCNFDRCISVHTFDSEIDMWIRLEYYDKWFNVSSVYFGEDFRNKGCLTDLYEKICETGVFTQFIITTPLTQEMINWCKHRDFSYKEINNQYIHYISRED